jgi:hypothetical protein
MLCGAAVRRAAGCRPNPREPCQWTRRPARRPATDRSRRTVRQPASARTPSATRPTVPAAPGPTGRRHRHPYGVPDEAVFVGRRRRTDLAAADTEQVSARDAALVRLLDAGAGPTVELLRAERRRTVLVDHQHAVAQAGRRRCGHEGLGNLDGGDRRIAHHRTIGSTGAALEPLGRGWSIVARRERGWPARPAPPSPDGSQRPGALVAEPSPDGGRRDAAQAGSWRVIPSGGVTSAAEAHRLHRCSVPKSRVTVWSRQRSQRWPT